VVAHVAVEGEGVGDGRLAHDDETGRGHEAEGCATGAEHVGFGDGKLGRGDGVEVNYGQIIFREWWDGGAAETILEPGPRCEMNVVR
jgi:hypothetical protein